MREIDDGIRRSSRTVDCQMCRGILYAMASMSLVSWGWGQQVGISTCWCWLLWCSFEKQGEGDYFSSAQD